MKNCSHREVNKNCPDCVISALANAQRALKAHIAVRARKMVYVKAMKKETQRAKG